MTLKIIVAVSFILISVNSYCQTDTTKNKYVIGAWLDAGNVDDGGKVYIQSTYLTKNDNGIKIWTKQTGGDKTVDGVTYKNVTAKILYVVDCKNKRLKLIQAVAYSHAGKVLNTVSVPSYEQEWQDIVPESVGEMILEKVCYYFN